MSAMIHAISSTPADDTLGQSGAGRATAAVPSFQPGQPGQPLTLARGHARRLREIYRSAGWPCRDMVEVELLAAGLLHRQQDGEGRETLRLTDAGIAALAESLRGNRAARSAHEALVEQVARVMQRDGRLVWQGLSLRADVALGRPATGLDAACGRPAPPGDGGDAADPGAAGASGWIEGLGPVRPIASPGQWKLCRPDVFSIRNTSLPGYLEPVVHEIKVSRADLLGDLKKADKRAAYLALGGQCWYVLGQDARGRAIAEPNEVPLECGVLVQQAGRLALARMAPRHPATGLPFHVWMALARNAPMPPLQDDPGEAGGGQPGLADEERPAGGV